MNPTPYEIFDQQKGSLYSKARFYELVKLYHPDRHHHTAHHDIPHTTKLERYRLVVAANDILSDPAKRRAYDLYGAGWAAQPGSAHEMHRAADRGWRQEPGSPSRNATWEDWERWSGERDERNGKKQEPLYTSNGGLVGVIVLFIFIGTWGRATYMGLLGHQVEMAERRHDIISQEVRRRQDGNAFLTRDQRVESFLGQREGWEHGARGHKPHSPDHK